MAIPKRKLRIRRGDTYTHQVTETQDDGSPANLTGATYLVQMRSDPDDAAYVAQFATTILNAATGEWKFSLTSTQTAGLEPGLYFYDVQKTHSDGFVQTLFEGEVIVDWDVSRA